MTSLHNDKLDLSSDKQKKLCPTVSVYSSHSMMAMALCVQRNLYVCKTPQQESWKLRFKYNNVIKITFVTDRPTYVQHHTTLCSNWMDEWHNTMVIICMYISVFDLKKNPCTKVISKLNKKKYLKTDKYFTN